MTSSLHSKVLGFANQRQWFYGASWLVSCCCFSWHLWLIFDISTEGIGQMRTSLFRMLTMQRWAGKTRQTWTLWNLMSSPKLLPCRPFSSLSSEDFCVCWLFLPAIAVFVLSENRAIAGNWLVPNPPGANPPGSWKAPLEVFAVLCDRGSAAYWKSPTHSCHFFCTPGNPCATLIVTHREGSFRYQGVSTRGVRHSPGENQDRPEILRNLERVNRAYWIEVPWTSLLL